jgi:serine/threonine-protein kinase
MALVAGSRLGTYEIVEPLGKGGMGEVYRARDTKLGRWVAVKVILDEFASNEERIGRFEREAKMLAALHHHRIASLFGLEHADGRHFLVMELVEGETLAERLRRGAIPVEDALPIAIQIAEALEAAHEKGVVHRDLKPANVKITPDGQVKVLDFGLAKAVETEATSGSAANSPTLSMMATQAGLILGTAAYMSPEQAKGFPADHRSDVFSFGVVMAEMLTGRQPFRGDTAPEVLASILVREPDTRGVPGDLNPRLLEIIKRCLEKNPKKRWQAIGDVRAELEAVAAAPRAVGVSAAARRPTPLWKLAVAISITAAVAAAAGAAAAWRWKPGATPVVYRFAIPLTGVNFTAAGRQMLDISPAGDRVAFVAGNNVYVRHVSEQDAKPLLNAESQRLAVNPVFSPDGRSIAFWTTGEQLLKTVAVTGGTPIIVARVDLPFGIRWTDRGILVGQGTSGIVRLQPSGGTVETIVKPGPLESTYGPQLLPDEDHVLFTLGSGKGAYGWSDPSIVVQSLRSGARKTVIANGSDGRYLPSGHIAYLIGGVVFAVPFDVQRLETVGQAVPIVEGVLRAPMGLSPASQFAVSRNGVMLYMPGPTAGASDRYDLTLVTRKGEGTPLKLPPAPYDSPRVSRDGKRVVVGSANVTDTFILVHDLGVGNVPRRLTFHGKNRYPIWTADGKRVVFQSDRDGNSGLFIQPVDGSREAQRLTRAASDEEHIPDDCSPTADVCLFTIRKGLDYTLSSVALTDGRITPVSSVAHNIPGAARFRPDGRWIAYGIRNPLTTIQIEPFPPTGARFQIQPQQGDSPHHPLWSPDGKELLFNPRPNGFSAVAVTTTPTVEFGAQFDVPRNFRTTPTQMRAHHDMMPDGRILGVVTPLEQGTPETPREIRIVLNWFEDLKSRLPK